MALTHLFIHSFALNYWRTLLTSAHSGTKVFLPVFNLPLFAKISQTELMCPLHLEKCILSLMARHRRKYLH